MRYIIKNMKNAGLALFAGMTMASCSDFLDILPLNEIVLENYWTEKADVQSVLTTCYASMEAPDCIKRMMVWGEFRSDNMIGNNPPNEIRQILEENLLETNPYAKWKSFYEVINYCNSVIHYAPLVQERDPNYSESELKANLAEVTALRSLCYFYLIRTFRDVPYTTEPSIDDVQNYKLPATKFDVVLDSIIFDLEKVQNDAVRKYAVENENTSLITRSAIWAMLADMYLWKQDYDNCIKYCNKVIDDKIRDYELLKEENDPVIRSLDLFNDYYPLYFESASGSSTSGYAYSNIFGTGNSFESIFELNFETNQSVKNDAVKDFYYNTESSSKGQTKPSDFLVSDPVESTNLLFKKTDSRFFENVSGGVIYKYAAMEIVVDNVGTKPTYTSSYMFSSRNVGNWIIYRLTDVMLMKAEALIEKAGDAEVVLPDDEETPVEGEQAEVVQDESGLAEQERLFRQAFSLISVVYNRANNITDDQKVSNAADTLVYASYGSSKRSMETLLLQERQRELMYEGKRWYDLVRFARREGNTSTLSGAAVMKQTKNASAIKIKLGAPDYIYFPYAESELKVNPNLVQNPAFANSNTASKQ